METYGDFLEKLAAMAGVIMRKHHTPAGVAFKLKADKTRVTLADEEIGQVVARMVRHHYPNAVLIREEAGFPTRRGMGLEFVIDELDSTKQYSEGGLEAVFAAAALIDGVVQNAIIHAPLFGVTPRNYTAALGVGSFCNEHPIRVSNRKGGGVRIAVATAGHPSERYDAQPIIARLEKVGGVVADVKSISYSCALLAAGELEGVLFPWNTLHDTAMGDLLVREAGGITSDLNGLPLEYHNNSVDGFIMANSVIMHKILFAIVREHHRTPAANC